jgi:hypothetical protein
MDVAQDRAISGTPRPKECGGPKRTYGPQLNSLGLLAEMTVTELAVVNTSNIAPPLVKRWWTIVVLVFIPPRAGSSMEVRSIAEGRCSRPGL